MLDFLRVHFFKVPPETSDLPHLVWLLHAWATTAAGLPFTPPGDPFGALLLGICFLHPLPPLPWLTPLRFWRGASLIDSCKVLRHRVGFCSQGFLPFAWWPPGSASPQMNIIAQVTDAGLGRAACSDHRIQQDIWAEALRAVVRFCSFLLDAGAKTLGRSRIAEPQLQFEQKIQLLSRYWDWEVVTSVKHNLSVSGKHLYSRFPIN